MKIPSERALLLLLAMTAHVIAAAPEEMSFQAAQEKAKAEKKILLIDFYTTWCVPCKKLDKVTWSDKAVGQLLTEKTVFLKVDAEKDVPLATRYKIDVYPTILLLKPDGTEIDRFVGFLPPEEFIADFKATLNGKDSVARAREAVEKAGGNDPMTRMSLGRTLTEKQDYAGALKEYAWCFENDSPTFVGVRLSFLLSDIKSLGRMYPQAIQTLRRWRDERAAKIISDSANALTVMELIRLNDTLDENDENLSLFDRIPPSNPSRQLLRQNIAPQLIGARRYKEALENTDPQAAFETQVAKVNQIIAVLTKEQRQEMEILFRAKATDVGAIYFEALAGTRKNEPALALAEQIIKFDSTPATREKLAEAAKRAGSPEIIDSLKSGD